MWQVETLNAVVDDEIEALPLDIKARLARYSLLIEAYGPGALPAKVAKHLEEKLWELRLPGRDGIARAIYLAASGRRVIIVRVFIKKTQKTPLRELQLARERSRSIP